MFRVEDTRRPRGVASALALLALLLASGCASTPTAEFRTELPEGTLARPHRIVVYDFAGSRGDLPADSQIAGHLAENEGMQSGEERERGRALGREVGRQLIAKLNDAGIEVLPSSAAGEPRVGDVLIRGEFVAVQPGSRTLRVLIGFGAGRGELSSLVEAFEVTPQGVRPLASARTRTRGGYLPGLLVPLGLAGSVGSVATSAVISGKSNAVQEMGPESMAAAAKRTADGVAVFIVDFYTERGWLSEAATANGG